MSARLPSSTSLRAAPVLSDAHLLVVDDRPNELQLLVEILRAAHCRISVAFDGLQAYHRAQAISPDLILMDVRMPHMDGFAACRLLTSTPSTQAIPIIMLTAAGDLEDRIEGLEIGAIDYIIKPFEPAEVIARIRNHLKKPPGSRPPEHLPALPDHPDASLVRAASEVLLRDLRNPPALEALAKLVGTHEKRLSRVFRDNLGQTVFEYLRDTRLRTAQRFLAQTSMGIGDIAQEIGFSNAGNFATAFRERFGVTPSDWRRLHGRGNATGTAEGRQPDA
ncbi:response regulator [Burkholderia thailandensis MSMB121]|uniref:Response regulator n=1 Tax=Burkholderia humptydooensis TaxID=430531 RepID=A0A7U4PAJ3_9BURK|nr:MULTISPECIES: response regulator [Burkholderia]AGK51662.1 response regulator [Burkholderia thailandensis MSMB121]ATF32988.1 DNA-binding response regulator [Burkholderia thailandensis]AJY40713.1 helix-turn-helix domain protein [Burkholderia sp. 2002721687]ALX46009.1 AraC family transcriptional regulator [Burkholderia humptydooensis]KST70834.1 AraC family transcriptional regulator [Burkholderia humptydooensis]